MSFAEAPAHSSDLVTGNSFTEVPVPKERELPGKGDQQVAKNFKTLGPGGIGAAPCILPDPVLGWEEDSVHWSLTEINFGGTLLPHSLEISFSHQARTMQSLWWSTKVWCQGASYSSDAQILRSSQKTHP